MAPFRMFASGHDLCHCGSHQILGTVKKCRTKQKMSLYCYECLWCIDIGSLDDSGWKGPEDVVISSKWHFGPATPEGNRMFGKEA